MEGKNLIGILAVEKADDFSAVESWEATDAIGNTYKLHVAPWYARVISHSRLRREWRRKKREQKP